MESINSFFFSYLAIHRKKLAVFLFNLNKIEFYPLSLSFWLFACLNRF